MGKHHILGTTALVALVVSMPQASAGGLAIREQSAWGEGSSYAGVAAGGSVSAMFWNPATMTQNGKFALENSVSMIFPETTQSGVNNLPAVLRINDGIPNSSEPAFVVAGYTSMQLNDRLWLGFSLNSPFGLSVGFNNPNWAGAFYGESSTLKTYNASPSVAYKVADWISVGVGFQAQYATVNLKTATGIPIAGFSSPNVNTAQLTGDGWGFGWTAGVTVTPTPWTQIGLGYRSAVNQSINGDFEQGHSLGRVRRGLLQGGNVTWHAGIGRVTIENRGPENPLMHRQEDGLAGRHGKGSRHGVARGAAQEPDWSALAEAGQGSI